MGTRVFHLEEPPVRSPGADIVNESKVSALGGGDLYPEGASIRIAVFGNSRILSGFVPARFDREVGRGVASFNLSLAGNSFFLDELDRLANSGNPPTHVLLQSVWESQRGETFLEAIKQDRAIINWAFPFRTLPRDLMLFAVLSRGQKGLMAYYRKSADTVHAIAENRGYFFIESQSHFRGHRLPDDYKLPTDTPFVVHPRPVTTSGRAFERIEQLSRKYNFQVLLIPDNFRRNAYADPPSANEVVDRPLAPFKRFHRIGPDYFLFENRYYADPVHLNPEGAQLYTERLARVFKGFLDALSTRVALRRKFFARSRCAFQRRLIPIIR